MTPQNRTNVRLCRNYEVKKSLKKCLTCLCASCNIYSVKREQRNRNPDGDGSRQKKNKKSLKNFLTEP